MLKNTEFNHCPHFHFSFPSLEQTDFIFRRLITGTDYLILVIGEQGSGKTRFLKRFIANNAAEAWSPCRIKTHRPKKGSRRLSLERASGTEGAYISMDTSAPPILLLDDAHRLAPPELHDLLLSGKPSVSDDGLRHVVLFCEPDFLSRIGWLRSSMPEISGINKLYMPKLTESQMFEFIKKWIETEGAAQVMMPLLKSRQLQTIYRLSAGIPGNVLEAVRQIFWKTGRGTPRSIFSTLKNFWRNQRTDASFFTT